VKITAVDEETYNDAKALCPKCGRMCKRHSTAYRQIRMTFGRVLKVKVSKIRCLHCKKIYVNPKLKELVPRGCRYHCEVVRAAVYLGGKYTLEVAKAKLLEGVGVDVPISTIYEWKIRHYKEVASMA